MLRGAARAAADRGPEQDRKLGLAAEHVVDLGRLVNDLIHRHERECHQPPVDDRAVSRSGGADRHAGQRTFRDRRVAHAPVAELLQQCRRRLRRKMKDLVVAAHFLRDRLDNGITVT